MSENLKESLSALMDNEVDDLELRRILKNLAEDKSLQETWERYHLVSSCLKREVHSKPSVDLLTGIHAALENEAVPASQFANSDIAHKSTGILGYMGQGAIAASVALVVLFSAELINTSTPIDATLADSPAVSDPNPLLNNTVFNATELRTAVLTEDTAEEQMVSEQLNENELLIETPANYNPE
jgi:sigma-E factor negative regulatory protein RseA